MKKIRILHILTTTAGGLGQSVFSLVTGLNPEKFDIVVAFGPGYPLDKKFVESGICVKHVRMKRGFKLANLAGFWDIYNFLRMEQFDIVHAHGPIAGFLGRLAAKLAGARMIIFSLHGSPSLNDNRIIDRMFLLFIEGLMRRCTDHFIAVSDYMKKTWIENGFASQHQVKVIHHGIDPRIRTDSVSQLEIRKMLDMPPDIPIIGTACLLEERKGIEYLIRAVPSVLVSFPKCKLIIIGEGSLRSRLQEITERLAVSHAVIFVGWRDDAAELMEIMDIFCLPSLREPFGLVFLEAMKFAKPVVATNVGGIPEVVSDGNTAILAPAMDTASLSDAIIYLLSNRKVMLEMGKKGRDRLLELFAREKMIKSYENMYIQFLNEKRRG